MKFPSLLLTAVAALAGSAAPAAPASPVLAAAPAPAVSADDQYYLFATFNDWDTVIDTRPGRPPIRSARRRSSLATRR